MQKRTGTSRDSRSPRSLTLREKFTIRTEDQRDTSKLKIRPIAETNSISEEDVKRSSCGYDIAIGVVWPRPLR